MMNPVFGPAMLGLMKVTFNMMLGIEHVSKKHASSINGRAFAPGTGVQQEETSDAKEQKVRAHLDKLAGEAKDRYLADVRKYPEVFEVKQATPAREYPYSDLIMLRDEAQAELEGTQA